MFVCCVCDLYISTMRLPRLKLDCCPKEEKEKMGCIRMRIICIPFFVIH